MHQEHLVPDKILYISILFIIEKYPERTQAEIQLNRELEVTVMEFIYQQDSFNGILIYKQMRNQNSEILF